MTMDRETHRRILVEALTAQAERYRARARDLHYTHARKPGHGFDEQADEQCRLAARAEEIRDGIKEAP